MSQQAVYIFLCGAVSNATTVTQHLPPPLRTIPGGGGASSPPRLRCPQLLIPGTTDRPLRERNTDSNHGTPHRRYQSSPTRSFAPKGYFRGQSETPKTHSPNAPRPRRIILGTARDQQEHRPISHSQTLLRPRRTFPGTTKAHAGRTTATIPSGACTSPPAPGHTAAPEGKGSGKKKDTRHRITSHSARTRSQVTPKTRPIVAEKPGAMTPRDRAKQGSAQKITQRSPSVSATPERAPDRRTNTPSAPSTIREDPTQSAHYRLWGQASSTCLLSQKNKHKPLPLELQPSRESREP